jgi:hypothetical protein
MPTSITINNVSGSSPFDVYLCNDPISTCVYIDTITTTPFTFTVPTILETLSSFNLKVVDDNNCQVILNLYDCGEIKQFEDEDNFYFMDNAPYVFMNQ